MSFELAEASAEHPSGAFEQKLCFQGVKLNGKGNWAPPTERTQLGLWDLSATETGTLAFNFALDPHAYKQEMSKINKMLTAAADSGKPIKDPALMKPKPKEFITVKTMSKSQATPAQIERLAQNLLKNYKEENFHANEVIIKDLLSKSSIWADQAFELLYPFRDNVLQFQRMVEFMLPKITDRHNRFKLIKHFNFEMQTMLTRISNNMGQAMNFNFWNPTGSYCLNLSVPEQREVANTILLLNKQFFAKVKAGEMKDRSQRGNASCLRNEKVGGGFITWTPDYVLPHMGNFEFEFIYLVPNRPTPEKATNDEEVV